VTLGGRRRTLAVDGRALRGIHGEELPAVRLVAAYGDEAGPVPAQAGVKDAEREAELMVAPALREPAPVAARLPSAPVAEVQAPQEPSRIEPAYAPQSGFGVTGKRPPRAITERAINTSDVEALAPPPLVAPSLAIATLTIDSIALEELETPARIAIASLATPEGEGP